MVEVFKTNVEQTEEAELLLRFFAEYFPEYKINFDLSDCDRILRVEGEDIILHNIIEALHKKNYQCAILE